MCFYSVLFVFLSIGILYVSSFVAVVGKLHSVGIVFFFVCFIRCHRLFVMCYSPTQFTFQVKHLIEGAYYAHNFVRSASFRLRLCKYFALKQKTKSTNIKRHIVLCVACSSSPSSSSDSSHFVVQSNRNH